MTSDIKELYDEQLKEHDKKPRNYGKLESSNKMAVGHNPLCGDKFVVYLQVENERVQDIKFEGEGCRISRASASMMTQAVKGKSKEEVENLFHEFHEMVLGKLDENSEGSSLGRLKIFAGVREHPVRVKCASLSWHTLKAALHGEGEVSTE